MIRALIADDHRIFREGLAELLTGQRLVKVVGHAADGAETLSRLNALAPQLLILDISMKVMNGLEVLERLRKNAVPVKVLVLSMHSDAHTIRSALGAGADGYVLKEEAFDEMERAVPEIMAGRRYISPLAKSALASAAVREEPASLSPREREILGLIAKGLTTREISSSLGISVKTVETHRQRLMEKLNCHKATELVVYALREGILGAEP